MSLKETVFGIAKKSGAFSFVRDSAWRKRRLMILCYHGVSMDDEHEWSPTLYITQERLRQRLQALKDGGYEILPLVEATNRLYAGTLPARAVALTFDDGAIDFERRALPVLREFNAPATLYLTTYYCLHRFPVFDTILSYVLWKGRSSAANLGPIIGEKEQRKVNTDAARNTTRNRMREYAAQKKMSAEEKDALVELIAKTLGVDYVAIKQRGTLQLMTPDTVRTLPRDLVDIQLHTHRHRTPLDHELFVREIRDNDEVIKDLVGDTRTLEHFCYPSGEYYGEFFKWLRECNVHYATTCVPDIATSTTEPMLLPRLVDTMQQSAVNFEAWISGFASLMPRKRQFRVDPARLTKAEVGVGTLPPARKR